MNNKKTLFMSLVIVLLIGLMISAGTFAYFQWTTDAGQRTNVNVTIEAGGIKMIMTPEGGILEAKGLKPVADCMESYAYFDTTIRIKNTTGSLVAPSFKLKARVKPNDAANAGTLKKSDLSHIHYTVVEIDRIGQEIKADKADDTGARRCYEPSHIQKSGVGRDGLFADTSNDGTVATGTFANMSQVLDGDGWTSAINLPSADNVYLARQYNDDTVKGDIGTFGITFMGDVANNTGMRNTDKYFRVYVWIDAGYTYTNSGTNMADPMNNAIIEVTWSEDSIVQQVTGEHLPGLYKNDGTYIDWATLVTNGDITVTDTTITDVSGDLTGDLLVADEITEIGMGAFTFSKLSEVLFGSNSQLATIDDSAFIDSNNLYELKLPPSLTTIGSAAFTNSIEKLSYEGTMAQWSSSVSKTSNWDYNVYFDRIFCIDGVIAPTS